MLTVRQIPHWGFQWDNERFMPIVLAYTAFIRANSLNRALGPLGSPIK